MRRYKLILAAAMTAMVITACGSGDGIVINGTTAEEVGNTAAESRTDTDAQKSSEDIVAEGSKGGTKIEIVTGETTAASAESAAQSLEGQTEPQTTPETRPVSTTAASTTAASTTAAPTRAPETTAARQYEVRDLKKTMYATSSVRIRASYSTNAEVLGALEVGEKIEVTGESENGWMRLNYKGHVAYVSKSYLTETAPSTSSGGSSSGQTSNSGQTSSSGQSNKPTSTTNSGTTPGGSTSSGGTTSPGSSTTPGGTTSPGGSTSPGGTTSPGGSTSPGGTSSPGGSSSSTGTGTSGSVTGNVTALDPSGLTVQTSDGKSYQFVWGDNVPALAPGEKVQIQYVTDNSGRNTVTQISK